jgi:hypothetical protein
MTLDNGRRSLSWVAGLLLLAGAVSAAPAWWVHAVAAMGRATASHVLPTVLIAAATVVLGWLAWSRKPRPALRPIPPITARLRLFIHVALLLVLAAVVAVLLGLGLWAALGQPLLGASSAAAPAGSATPGASPAAWTVGNTLEAIKIVLVVVAGIGGVVALTVAYRKQDLGEAAEHREDTKLFTERFTKTAEQLGSAQAAVRIAGVYAMSRLADDWAEERQTCIDVLCAYLRMPYTPVEETSPADELYEAAADSSLGARQERTVRHTAIRLIAAHLKADADTSWQGYRFDLTGAILDGGDLIGITLTAGTTLDFSGARFSTGEVKFSGARFAGGRVYFSGAQFADGLVDFAFTEVADGAIDFGGAQFSGAAVHFGDAKLLGGWISFRDTEFLRGLIYFGGAEFVGCAVNFEGAKFTGGLLSFGGAEDADRGHTFCGAKFVSSKVYFRHVEFSGGKVHFGGHFPGGAEFVGGTVDFGDAEFADGAVDFDGAVSPAAW